MIVRKLGLDRLRDSALDALVKRTVVVRNEVNLANSAVLLFAEATCEEPQEGPVEVELARGSEADCEDLQARVVRRGQPVQHVEHPVHAREHVRRRSEPNVAQRARDGEV